jgi:hypothetical protein
MEPTFGAADFASTGRAGLGQRDRFGDHHFGFLRKLSVPIEAQRSEFFLDLRHPESVAWAKRRFDPRAGALKEIAPPFVAFWIALSPLEMSFRRVKEARMCLYQFDFPIPRQVSTRKRFGRDIEEPIVLGFVLPARQDAILSINRSAYYADKPDSSLPRYRLSPAVAGASRQEPAIASVETAVVTTNFAGIGGIYIRPFYRPLDLDPRSCRQRAFPEDMEEAASLYDLHHRDGVAFVRLESILNASAGVVY